MGQNLRKKSFGTLSLRVCKEGRRLSELQNFASIHEHYSVRDAAGKPHFVCNNYHRHAFFGQGGNYLEDLVNHLGV